jgi:hypothetical protein
MLQDMIDRLPEGASWSGVKADDLGTSEIKPIEAQVLEAAEQEGREPSPENLPEDGTLLRRDSIDPTTGLHQINWHGRRSFIHDFARPGRKVLRLVGKDGRVLLGRPWSMPPT